MKLRDFLLQEKYQTAMKNIAGQTIEIFKNPSRKEMQEVMGKRGVRFIADAKNKTLYVWDAMGVLHGEAWKKIKNETGDNRVLYKSDEILTGVYKTKAHSDAAGFLPQSIRESMKEKDWSWTEKWFSVDDIVRKL